MVVKVIMRTAAAGPVWSARPGQVIAVDAETAEALVGGGFASWAKPSAAEKAAASRAAAERVAVAEKAAAEKAADERAAAERAAAEKAVAEQATAPAPEKAIGKRQRGK